SSPRPSTSPARRAARSRSPPSGYRQGVANAPAAAPGVRTRPARFVPRLHWELLVCGIAGHELVGLDAAHVRPEDALVVREIDGARWHRCLRCDSWLALPPPQAPARECPPDRDAIE